MENENNFQNCFFILMSLLGFNARPEVHTSDGRIDLLITTERFVYIIELKYDSTASEALEQICRKNYELAYTGAGKKIFRIGVEFSSRTRTIVDWKISSRPS